MGGADAADWIWINPTVIETIHDAQLAEHGGLAGIRDSGMLASAVSVGGDAGLCTAAASFVW